MHDPYYEEFFDIADIPRHVLKEVEYFFSTYKDLEGKRVQIEGLGEERRGDAKVITESIERYDAAYLRARTMNGERRRWRSATLSSGGRGATWFARRRMTDV